MIDWSKPIRTVVSKRKAVHYVVDDCHLVRIEKGPEHDYHTIVQVDNLGRLFYGVKQHGWTREYLQSEYYVENVPTAKYLGVFLSAYGQWVVQNEPSFSRIEDAQDWIDAGPPSQKRRIIYVGDEQ